MSASATRVDGFRFLPPKLAAWIKTFIPESYEGDIPFTPLEKPLNEVRLALVTSAGISVKQDPPFDMEREKEEPGNGDPSSRMIPANVLADGFEVNHLHINTRPILEDINVILPLDRMDELAKEGVIGALAPTAYSFYGFQWYRRDFLEEGVAPMIAQMQKEGVDAVLLTPA